MGPLLVGLLGFGLGRSGRLGRGLLPVRPPRQLRERLLGQPQRRAALLAVDLEGVVAWLGTEGDAAARPDRRARRPGAGAAGALLAPRLGGAAPHLGARLG